MNDYLIFRLSAALGAMGGHAGNERRGSNQWPARSAINGLIGGALGIDRADTPTITALQSSLKMGITRLTLGSALTDFHTAQTIPTAAVKRPPSRPQAFAQVKDTKRIMTVLTQREYYQECCFDVAITTATDSQWGLEQLQTALQHPHYTPYFGRKACPLDKPLHPVIIHSQDILTAFQQYQSLDAHPATDTPAGDDIIAQLDPTLLPKDHSAMESAISMQLRDQIVDRQHWSFSTSTSIQVQQKRQTH